MHNIKIVIIAWKTCCIITKWWKQYRHCSLLVNNHFLSLLTCSTSLKNFICNQISIILYQTIARFFETKFSLVEVIQMFILQQFQWNFNKVISYYSWDDISSVRILTIYSQIISLISILLLYCYNLNLFRKRKSHGLNLLALFLTLTKLKIS